MIKFMVLFRHPADIDRFENTYNDFLGLIERMPDVQRRQVVHTMGSPQGTPEYYRILEIYYESQEAMQESLRTAIGQEAGSELNRFPSNSYELMYAEVYEEEGGQTK